MFSFLGRMAYRWRWAILIVWGAALLLSLPVLPRVAGSLKVGGFSSPNTEAAHAREVLQRELGFAPSTLLVVYQSDELKADDPRSRRRSIGRWPESDAAECHRDHSSRVRSESDLGRRRYRVRRRRALGGSGGCAAPGPGVRSRARATDEGADVGRRRGASYRDIETASQRDLRRAEVIVFPIALVALLLVFGSVVAALMPLAVGAAGVALVLVSIFVATRVTDLSIFVLNLATMLGLGLSVDYSLFVTSRFREELARNGGNVPLAVERTIATAGKAVFFSGATVLIGLMGLALFEFMFLRSVGIAGVIVVAWSTVAALTLLPALLSLVGTRIDRFAIRRPRDDTAGRVLGAPLTRGDGTTARGADPDAGAALAARISLSAGQYLVARRDDPAARSPVAASVRHSGVGVRRRGDLPFLIVLQSETPGDLFTGSISARSTLSARGWPMTPRDPGAEHRAPDAAARGGDRGRDAATGLSRLGVGTGAGRLANDNAAVIVAYTSFLPNDEENKALLAELRAMELPGLTLLVDGGTAEIVDVVDEMYADFPKAIALVVAATYLVLLVLFRSVLLPLKAVLMNGLSILASYGALVWVFQEGNLSRFLGFTGLGFVEASLPVIMFCVLFGLSMDYEVFLLSRIREEWERTGNNTQAVAVGLQRSGRIITSAALLVVVVAGSFVTADVVLIKALGFGIALAVFLDATVVRALLVPSTMRLLGDWNWWLPSPLHRLLPARPLVEESV